MTAAEYLVNVEALARKLNAVLYGENALLASSALALELCAGLEQQATRGREPEALRRLRLELCDFLTSSTRAAMRATTHGTVQ